MEARFLSLERKALEFVVDDCDIALVNAVRRVVIAEVPYVSLAQDDFEFRANTGVLHNHFLAHRLTLAPIHLSRQEADAYVPGSIKVGLAVKNDGKSAMDVTTESMTATLHDQPHPDAARLYPADPLTGDHVLLTVLKPGEEIDVTGHAVRGTAGDHASFAVASMCAFSPVLDNDLVAKGREEAKARGAMAVNRFEHIEQKRAWVAGPDGNPRSFKFQIVSECGMSALDVLQSAMDVLERKVETAAPAAIRPGRISEIEVSGEGATLGNLLQSTALDELVGDAPKPLSFAGYICPHPLEKRVLFRVVASDSSESGLKAAFASMKEAALERVRALSHALSEAAAAFSQ